MQYQHSGSEAPRDDFVFVRSLATTSYDRMDNESVRHSSSRDSKAALPLVYHHSAPMKITVKVTNENDEPPIVSVNDGVEMWQEDTVILTRKMLGQLP